MSILKNKIDFVAFISANMANVNGDPLNGNRPRTDYDGYGEMSDVCIKRKIRNRMQDMGNYIFVQSDDRRDGRDNAKSLKERAESIPELNEAAKKKDEDMFVQIACKTWMDVRSFGQVFAFSNEKKKEKEKEKEKGVSIGIRGPVSIHQAVSVDPIDIESMQITKSVNGEPGEKKGSDTMGQKHFVRFGLYEIKGSINVQLAEKTGFTEEDAQTIKECLRTLFVNDASSARPDGSMEVYRLYWFQHSCKDGQYSSAKVHRSIKVCLKDENKVPASVDDYDITVEELPGLKPEIIEGV